MNTAETHCNASKRKIVIFSWIAIAIVLMITASIGGYMVGRNNEGAREISAQSISLPITYYSLAEMDKQKEMLDMLDRQIDSGIIAAVRFDKDRTLSENTRITLRLALRKAFLFRRIHPFILIETNNLTPDFQKQLQSALSKYGSATN